METEAVYNPTIADFVTLPLPALWARLAILTPRPMLLNPDPTTSGAMNTAQRYAMLVAAANLVLLLLFPPYDYVSMLLGNVPTFDGFYFVFAGEPHRVVNVNFLMLEMFVVLINAGIAWLLLRTPMPRHHVPPRAIRGSAPYSG
jgi:hypothetical protein